MSDLRNNMQHLCALVFMVTGYDVSICLTEYMRDTELKQAEHIFWGTYVAHAIEIPTVPVTSPWILEQSLPGTAALQRDREKTQKDLRLL